MNAAAKLKVVVEVSAPVRYDRERMERALASKSTQIPAGLSREQKRLFILSN